MEGQFMKAKRKIIQIDEKKCDGCGLCVPACAEGAIQVIDGKAKLVAEIYCDGLGECLGECPRDALKITEREADKFDEFAVEEHMKSQKGALAPEAPTMACGCPSSQIVSFASLQPSRNTNKPIAQTEIASTLAHWPVQIRLVPPTAPFLKNADLLIVADCTPVAYPRLHDDFLKGKVVLMGCPKFDETEMYVHRFAQIFKEADIKSVTVLVMEVPCCQGLPEIIRKGMDLAGKKIPLEKVVIGRTGGVLKREFLKV
jgi:MinD superfamily P-loop ATPase containing an inserted ferredoxin domain